MGPIADERGLEQGVVNSSDFYKIFGKDQLHSAQQSGLGVHMRDIVVGSIGQADDTGHVANNIHDIQNLLELSLDFCAKYQVELCVEKTKLLAFATKEMASSVDYQKSTSPVNINVDKICFVDSAEHVGILRSVPGNLPNILKQIMAQKKKIGAVL